MENIDNNQKLDVNELCFYCLYVIEGRHGILFNYKIEVKRSVNDKMIGKLFLKHICATPTHILTF
jgi:hypothetical protein